MMPDHSDPKSQLLGVAGPNDTDSCAAQGKAQVFQVEDLVESNDEGGLPHLKQLNGLNSLWLQPVHEVHDKNGNVTQP